MADKVVEPVLVSVGKRCADLYVGLLSNYVVTGKCVRVVLKECRRIEPVAWAEADELETMSEHIVSDLYPGHLATVGVPEDWRVGAAISKMVLTRVDEISFLSEAAWLSVKSREASPLRVRRREEFTEEEQEQEDPVPPKIRWKEEALPQDQPQDTQTAVEPSKDEPSPSNPPAEETQSTPE